MHSQNGRRVILVAGVPATGKSYFGNWVARECSFIHADLEKTGSIASLGVQSEWDHLINSRDAAPLMGILSQRPTGTLLDWGFPAHCLPVVAALKQRGAELWWFDADINSARKAFSERATVPIANFEIQVAAIQHARSKIDELFEPNIIAVLDANGNRTTCSEIWRQMEAHAV